MRKREFNNRMSLRGAYLYATWQSQQNKRRSRDPHVSPSDFLRMTILIQVSLRGDNRGQAIFELGKNKLIRRPLEFFALQKIGVTLHAVILGQQRVTRVSRIIKWILGSSPRITGERKCPMMTMLMWILVSSTSMAATARAECVPTPDCASIGYTATSCEGGFVRCPFDTSKLLCIPCDTKYKYTCSGNNIIGGVGSACNGKYISCECSGGGTFNNGECPQNCEVGYIYYSDKSCSSSYNSSKTVAGIVVKKNELVMSKPTYMTWSSSYDNVSGLTDITSSSTAKADMNGKSNTSTIVSYHTSIGESTSTSAALYCNSYTGGISGTLGQWYLPAAGELYSYVYGNYGTLNPVATTLSWSYFVNWFWSSSERSYNYAWIVFSSDGGVGSNYKDQNRSVSCFLEI